MVDSPPRSTGKTKANMTPKEENQVGVEDVAPIDFEDVEDAETAELSRLRCTSMRTEEIADREKAKKEREQRRNRCADYPGLAFGSAAFGSETMMKFNIIKNELHNIMRSQLKRVDGEVSALSQRIKDLDSNLELSENYIKTSTAALADAVAMEVETRRKTEDVSESDPLGQFDAQMALLEAKLTEAKALASKADGVPVHRNVVERVVISRPPVKGTQLRRPLAQQQE